MTYRRHDKCISRLYSTRYSSYRVFGLIIYSNRYRKPNCLYIVVLVLVSGTVVIYCLFVRIDTEYPCKRREVHLPEVPVAL